MTDPAHIGITAKQERFDYCWVVLAVGTLAIFAALGLGRFGYTVVLPAMQQGLAMDNTQAGLMATLNLAGYLLFSVIGGALASHYGPRRVIAGGLLLVGVGMVLTGVAGSFVSAAFWRAMTGLGSGAANIAAMGMWSTWFPMERRGLASGVAVTGSSLGLIFAGPLAPQIMALYGGNGWRVCWFIFGGLSLVISMAVLLLVPRANKEGTASSCRPALRWGEVYRSGAVWRLGLVYVACGFSYIIYMTFFVKRLVAEGGYSREGAGALFMTMGWCSLICGFLWGTISDRIGRQQTLVAIYLLHTVSFALFALWPAPSGFLLSAILFGMSAWSIPAIMAATCGDVMGPQLAPATLGFITLFFGCGQALGPTVAGAMADAGGSFASAYLLAAAVALAGAIGAIVIFPAKKPPVE
jgi:predicted MFS family arabinose efflux permease